MKNQPRINLPTSSFEKFSTLLSFLAILAAFIYLFIVWNRIPDTIPVHFNVSGEPDRYGGKWSVVALPVISLSIWVTFTILEKYPHVYNYTIHVNENNAEVQYKNAVLMLSSLKLVIALTFAYLTWASIQIGLGYQQSLGLWPMVITLGGTLGVAFFFLIRSLLLK
ncbi:DUF1648 domain-containing protein [Halobacillus shinanisalinarum]|uniref:DUF1648 domain-containing protein n=1 Tax=Halobacillus shinanisalinarum TaxID=2932258 RepID=A0ABY4H610_9BACI|nr:DUF1648 domain-containing protein [Halobacillus shinanisalinarum]UOQ95027.1 DUF1648 domain-containing protein [Halobacillus shinanisalinarum]